MYTGIVRGAFPVTSIIRQSDLLTYGVKLPASLLENITLGASVNIDGTCQTVIKNDNNTLYFDASTETLMLTTLGNLKVGDRVHVERSAKVTDENGGHVISGHVDGKAVITQHRHSSNQTIVTIEIPSLFRRYVFNKGFIGLHGCSLTVCNYDFECGRFEVHLIPETLRLTTFGEKKIGDELNLEIDRQSQVLVDTIERTFERSVRHLIEVNFEKLLLAKKSSQEPTDQE